ncbi:MAG TPA: hypothetical protein VGH44_04265 [Candidatus Saccharimonadia bacterium]|jgi:hypothetical protein
MSDFEVRNDGTVTFPTGYAGIPDHVWYEMLGAHPQLRILRDHPMRDSATPFSQQRITWTIHPPEPLTDQERAQWVPGSQTGKPMHIYLVPNVEKSGPINEVESHQSLEELIARRTNEINLEPIGWVIFVQTSTDKSYHDHAEVWQCQVRPAQPGHLGQLEAWRANARSEAARAFKRESPN